MATTKQRNGWLKAWLVFMIIANVAVALYYIPRLAGWDVAVFTIMTLFNLICVVALFMWKKWGFWGICVSAIITFILMVNSGFDISLATSGLFTPIILYGMLNIGKKNKGWPQLG